MLAELRAFLLVLVSPNVKLLTQAQPGFKTFGFFLFHSQIEITTKLALCFIFIALILFQFVIYLFLLAHLALPQDFGQVWRY